MASTAFYGDFSESVTGSSFVTMTLSAGLDDGFLNPSDPTQICFPADGFYVLLCGWTMFPRSSQRQGQFLLNGTDVLALNESGQGAVGASSTGGNLFYAGSFCEGDCVEVQVRYTLSSTGSASGNVIVFRVPDPCFIGSGDRSSPGVVDLVEARDTGGWHSDSTNPSEVIVDATAGYLFLARAKNNHDNDLKLNVNGSQFQTASKNSHGSTVNGYALLAGVVALTSGDVVEIEVTATDGTTDAQLLLCEIPDDYAMVTQSSSESIPPYGSGAPKLLAYDSEEVDTNGFHSNVTNNQRLTVPADSRYLVLGQLRLPGFAIIDTFMELNGSTIANTDCGVESYTSGSYGSCVTMYLADATSGDYFTHRAFHDSGSTLSTFTNGTRFTIVDLASWSSTDDFSCDTFIPQFFRLPT